MKIKVGAVSYLNTKPLVYGFDQGIMQDELMLTYEYPSKLAEKLLGNNIDIGLVPVAVIPNLPEAYIISQYGITCDGEVASVCLFSEVPVEEIKTIILDYQSRTSVALLKVLLREYWKISPLLEIGEVGYENNIKGTTGGLVIGDRAFQQRLKSAYIYDLGHAWKAHTGSPFVFATWVSNKPVSPEFISRFDYANGKGIENIEDVIRQNPNHQYDLKKYYTENIIYKPDFDMIPVINLFLDKIKSNS